MKNSMNFNQLVEKSINTKKTTQHNCTLEIEVNGDIWKTYSASVSNRDILFFCDKGTATYLVDSYGTAWVAELFDWELDGEN